MLIPKMLRSLVLCKNTTWRPFPLRMKWDVWSVECNRWHRGRNQDEATEDYQLAAGISQDVGLRWQHFGVDKSAFTLVGVGTFGRICIRKSSRIIWRSNGQSRKLFFFTPLIAAMAGNVGVQSSAIIVQGLANDTLSGSLFNRLIKEVSLVYSTDWSHWPPFLFFGKSFSLNVEFIIGIIVTIALVSVIIIASLIGTFVPLLLDKFGIDPALATGPFITTSNDICGILIYFSICKIDFGF